MPPDLLRAFSALQQLAFTVVLFKLIMIIFAEQR
jgi:hypothetical protein